MVNSAIIEYDLVVYNSASCKFESPRFVVRKGTYYDLDLIEVGYWRKVGKDWIGNRVSIKDAFSLYLSVSIERYFGRGRNLQTDLLVDMPSFEF